MSKLVISAVIFCVASAAIAQGYPNRPVRIVVPAAAGSGPDLVVRLAAPPMGNRLGQPVIVENKPGAEGVIAASEVAKSAPYGYTLLATNSTIIAANPAFKKQLPYDPLKNFALITRFVTAPLILVVKADFPAQNFREFLGYAKARPGELIGGWAMGGSQIAIVQLKSLAGVNVMDVAYKGNPQAVTDVLGGRVTFAFSDTTGAFNLIKAGKVKGLAVTSPERSPLAPDLPALAESLPGFDVTVWSGLAAPAGTPQEIVNRLYDAASKGITQPDVKARLAALSVEVSPLQPDDFAAFSRREIAKWAKQVKEAGIQPE